MTPKTTKLLVQDIELIQMDCLALVGTVTGGSTNSISWGSAATWFSLGNSGAAKITYDDYTKLVVCSKQEETVKW